jgi:phosphonate transport system substrate-binding protein
LKNQSSGAAIDDKAREAIGAPQTIALKRRDVPQQILVLKSVFMFLKMVFAALIGFALTNAASAQPDSNGQTLVFAINEGVTYKTGADTTRQNYKVIADDLARLLKTKVRIDVVPEYATLEKELAAKAYDFAFIHPTHIALTPVKKGSYSLVAVSKAHINYKASFLTRMNAEAKSPEQLGRLMAATSKPVGSPDTNSITAYLIRATLRDAAAASKSSVPPLKFTRYQDSIPFMVDAGFVDVAATASESIVKEWIAAGGKVMVASKSVPIKNLIVSDALGKEAAETIKAYFLELSTTTDGQAKLERIGLKQGFVTYDQAAYVALGTWLGL